MTTKSVLLADQQRTAGSAAPDNGRMDDWSAPSVRPVGEKDHWEKTYCGCMTCFHKGYYDPKKVPPSGRCYKAIAYDSVLEQLARERIGLAIKPGWKPASSAKLAEWASWLTSKEAAEAAERLSAKESQGKRNWNTYKFNPVAMERHIQGMWPHEQSHFKTGPMYLAYMAFSRKQWSAKEDYVAKAASIKTMEDYDNAEEAYKTLFAHVNDHGDICGMPKKTHKKPAEATPEGPKKMGRRAARKARNESEKSEATAKQYSRADLRALVRTQEGGDDDKDTVDSDAESDNDE